MDTRIRSQQQRGAMDEVSHPEIKVETDVVSVGESVARSESPHHRSTVDNVCQKPDLKTC